MSSELILGFDGQVVISVSVLVWAACLSVIYRVCMTRLSGGVPLAYAILLSVIHSGALIYLLPWYNPLNNDYLAQQGASLYETAIGLAISSLGMMGLCFGIWISDSVMLPKPVSQVVGYDAFKFAKWLMALGAGFFFVIGPVAKRIPSGASIASNGVHLAIVGICLFAALGLRSGLFQQMRAMAASMSLPGITMMFMGFVGYGVAAVTEIGCFVLKSIRVRWWAYPAAVLVFWFALSFYVTYMEGRERLRDTVWGGSSLSARFYAMVGSFSEPELFNPADVRHLYLVDIRLNQNALVGRSHVFIRDTETDYAWGESIKIAAVAWIPRALWQDKPSFGGSAGFASRFTGMTFSESTSVGVGLVMEMYANFGLPGTFLGFMLFGVLLRYVDHVAAYRLMKGRLWDFAQFQLMGFAMVQPGGFLAECVASVAAAYVLVRVLKVIAPNVTTS